MKELLALWLLCDAERSQQQKCSLPATLAAPAVFGTVRQGNYGTASQICISVSCCGCFEDKHWILIIIWAPSSARVTGASIHMHATVLQEWRLRQGGK
jgi:hypothetical protein